MAKTLDLLSQDPFNPLLINLPLLQRPESYNGISQAALQQLVSGCDLDSANWCTHVNLWELGNMRRRRTEKKKTSNFTGGDHGSSMILKHLPTLATL